MQDMSDNECWLVVAAEICDGVSREWLEALTRKQVYLIALETYHTLYYFDSPEYLAWYDANVLTEVDQLQDTVTVQHLTLGIQVLTRFWPMVVARAHRTVEGWFIAQQKDTSQKKSSN